MRTRKPSIPSAPKGAEPRAAFDSAVKETLETITGRRNSKITPLAPDATLAQVIDKVNAIVALLQ